MPAVQWKETVVLLSDGRELVRFESKRRFAEGEESRQSDRLKTAAATIRMSAVHILDARRCQSSIGLDHVVESAADGRRLEVGS